MLTLQTTYINTWSTIMLHPSKMWAHQVQLFISEEIVQPKNWKFICIHIKKNGRFYSLLIFSNANHQKGDGAEVLKYSLAIPFQYQWHQLLLLTMVYKGFPNTTETSKWTTIPGQDSANVPNLWWCLFSNGWGYLVVFSLMNWPIKPRLCKCFRFKMIFVSLFIEGA